MDYKLEWAKPPFPTAQRTVCNFAPEIGRFHLRKTKITGPGKRGVKEPRIDCGSKLEPMEFLIMGKKLKLAVPMALK